MKLEIVIAKVGSPDKSGDIFTPEILAAIVEADPETYRLDRQGNLLQAFTDEGSEELRAKLLGTPAQDVEIDDALDNFVEVLKHRQKQGLPGRYSPGTGWVPIQNYMTSSEEEE